MVIEKILKVNSTDPKVDELRQRLNQIQQKVQPQAPSQPTTTPSVSAPQPQAPPPKLDKDLANLQEMSFQDQQRAIQSKNPELKLKEERTMHLIMNQIKELITLNNESNKRIKEVESKNVDLQKQLESQKDKNEELVQKMNSIDSRLEKFMGLYELITNQYNPFAETIAPANSPKFQAPAPAQPAAKAAPVPVKPATPQVVQIEDNLTKEKATVKVSAQDAAHADEQFRKVEGMLADLQKQQDDARHAKQPVVAIPPTNLTSELHALLAGFEQRLQQQLDQTLQTKMHQGFTQLEQSLQAELRDALREEIAAVQQDDQQVQAAMTELEQLSKGLDSVHKQPVEDELATLGKELARMRDEVRALPPYLYFRVADGQILKNLDDFKTALHHMSPETYARHVDHDRNDFADWIEHALQRKDVADAVRKATTWPELEAAIAKY
jgi:hypothetical protein